ncbi:MAG: cellulase family glycosylhydrolase [Actinomycetota bacterium]
MGSRSGHRSIGMALALAILATACGDDGAPDASPTSVPSSSTTTVAAPAEAPATTVTAPAPGASVADVVELRPLWTSDDRRIVDDLDREVLLRGPNINSLGEYWQGDPEHSPTLEVSDADWDEMARRGFSVIRLIVTWSRIEPTRGEIDEAYLDQVDAYVRAAAEHGMYSVIDMHQDAYSAFIATESEDECADGSRPGKGWDGAPAWATITDGLSTCVTGERNSAPAVVAAWNHFWDDTDGIQQRFVASWAAVADRFAGRPEVAGYDVLNEPEVSRPAAELAPAYDRLLADTIGAIRAAEAGRGAPHLIFVEPGIPAADGTHGLLFGDPAAVGADVDGVVYAAHNYGESISQDFTIEVTFDFYDSVASDRGMPSWFGEYGFWDTSEPTLEKVHRFAAAEDERVLGGAWWQWRQGCGDPHSLDWGRPAAFDQIHLNIVGCPGDVDLGPNEAFLSVLGRGYPRVAPGRVVRLESDPATGALDVAATGAPIGDRVTVWSPTTAATHGIEVVGLDDVEQHEVPGGRIITATTADGAWEIRVIPS